MKSRLLISIPIMATLVLIIGCSDEVQVNNPAPIDSGDGSWSIPTAEVFDGGPGKDGIPALTTPNMQSIDEVTYLRNSDRVIGVRIGDEVRAYPHPILDWHEIINDQISGTAFAVTYCPLTGSAIGWSRVIGGQATTFGVSGLLYNTNLIPYDRATNSNWSQMLLRSVQGTNKGLEVETFPIVETSWETWQAMYPSSQVVSTGTGFNRRYGVYPYGDYLTNNQRLLFPINNDDSRLPRKDRVLGVIAGAKVRAYQLSNFPAGVELIEDELNGMPLVIAGSSGADLAVAYQRRVANGPVLTFTAVENALPAIMIDNEGTTWDVFGRGIAGPRQGEQLAATRSFIAFWFAWATFYPEVELYGEQ